MTLTLTTTGLRRGPATCGAFRSSADLPETPRRIRPAPVFHLAPCRRAELATQFFIGAQLTRRLAKFGQIAAAGDKAILAMGHQLARSPLVGDHARQARGLCFEYDVSESIGRSGED